MKHLILLFFIAYLAPIQLFAQPSITSFSPISGPIGTIVTISGANFSTTPSANTIYFGAVKANITSATSTSLTVTVPMGATYQPITVTVNGLTAVATLPFNVTFTGGELTPKSFNLALSLDDVINTETNEMVSGDFDSDGKLDIAVVDRLNNNLSVYRNKNTANNFSFDQKINFTTGTQPVSIASGDLDGDGKLDFAVVNKNDSSISVVRNTSTAGNISFAPKVDFRIASQPLDIVLADFDGDGKIDMAVANAATVPSFVSVLRNTGSPGTINFAVDKDIEVLLPGSNIAIGDFNNDKKQDIVITSIASNSMSVLSNSSATGSIRFAAAVNYTTGTMPSGLAVGDLNRDGKADIVLANFNSNTVSIYRNTSNGGSASFAPKVDLPAPGADNVSILDANGDSFPDLAVQTFSPSGFSVLRNMGNGGAITFAPAVSFTGVCGNGVLVGDWDEDGKTDIGIGCGFMRVGIWKNKTTEPQITSFTPASSFAGATVTLSGKNFTGTTSITFGGVQASGFTVVSSDMINAVVGNGASGSVLVSSPNGSDSLEGYIYIPPPTITSFTPSTAKLGTSVTIMGTNFINVTSVSFGGVPAASFTVENTTKIIAVVGSGASGSVSVKASGVDAERGGFIYLPPPKIVSFTPTTGTINTEITVSGTNFTGATKVQFGGIPAASFKVISPTTITANVLGGSSGKVSITTPGGSDSLPGFIFVSPPPPTITSFMPATGRVGTIVTISGNNFNPNPSHNYVYFGSTQATVVSSSTTTLKVTVPTGAVSHSISVTTNFLTCQSTKKFIVTFPGGGNISSKSFEGPLSFGIGSTPLNVYLNDLDGDGKNDLIACLSPGEIAILRNTSNGTISFAPPVTYDYYMVEKLLIAEMDGDGKPDIIRIGRKSFDVLKNISTPGTINFAEPVGYYLADEPRSIATSDFDKDGKFDIVISYFSSISIIANTSIVNHISFAPAINYKGGFQNKALSIADFDGDDKTDIAFLGDSVCVMRNVTNGGRIEFGPIIKFAASPGHDDLKIADMDGNDKPDLVISNGAPSYSVSIFRNMSIAGSILFANKNDFMSGGPEPSYLAVEDLDGDEKMDVCFTHGYLPRVISVMKNKSDSGTIALAQSVHYKNNTSGKFTGICAGDIDGDGKPEIISTSGNYFPMDIVYIYRNKTDGPHITSFTPENGIAGTVITISGSNFTGATSVSFGGVPATSFTVVSPKLITAVLSAGAAGEVSVTTPLGNASVPGFLYGLKPTVTSFNPTSGRTYQIVTIKGTNFTNPISVSFGGASSQRVTIVDSNTIQAAIGLGTSGDVSVTTSVGTASLPGFTYIPFAPIISSFSPERATVGDVVTIKGAEFTGVSAVSFGGVPASSFTVRDFYEIRATVGNGATGSVNVTSPGGTSSKAGFTFISNTPVITSFFPASAPKDSTITITGTNLSGATSVSFGGVSASSFTVVNATTIKAIVGNGATGNVVIITPTGTATLAGFTFVPAPTISSFTPTSGPSGTLVTITGTNFTGTTAVAFGGVPAQSFAVNSSTSIFAAVGSGGTGNLTVTTPHGTATKSGFSFNVVTSVIPVYTNSKDLVVNPNPGNGEILIHYPAIRGNAKLKFIDILGRTVKEISVTKNTNQTKINLNVLGDGVYFIVWSDGLHNLTRTFILKR